MASLTDNAPGCGIAVARRRALGIYIFAEARIMIALYQTNMAKEKSLDARVQAAQARLDLLAQEANGGQFDFEEALEYDRFIQSGDIVATLRLKAEALNLLPLISFHTLFPATTARPCCRVKHSAATRSGGNPFDNSSSSVHRAICGFPRARPQN